MLKRTRIAIKLRQTKWIYASYLSLISTFRFKSYNSLQSFVLFIGYPRSGSSTLGSILDAHKNIILSHELNVLNYIKLGYSKRQIFTLIEKNSRLFSATDRKSSGYSGLVKNQHNAKASPLAILGDKKAGGTSLILGQNPELIRMLKQCLGLPVKFIHIVRNPFDMITTQAYGGNEKQNNISEEDILKAIHFCFNKFDLVAEYLNSEELDIYTIHHENLLADSDFELKELLARLGVDADQKYLQACRNHLFKVPHRSRSKFEWTRQQKELVLKKIADISFLRHYTFEN